MPAMYEIQWLFDGRTESFPGTRGIYYEFSESDALDVDTVPVWCPQCATIVHGEYLGTVEEIDRQIRDLQDPGSRLCAMARKLGNGEAFFREWVEKLERRRRWRVARRSPAKCIRCGCANIVPLPIGETWRCPNGGDELRIVCNGMCSTEFEELFFTPEGDRIPRETRPTYWRHPVLDQPTPQQGLQNWLRKRGLIR